jgi:hypothetical protein
MLKFSGFADLTSCHGRDHSKIKISGLVVTSMKCFNSIRIQQESFESHQLFIDMMHCKRQHHRMLYCEEEIKALTLRNT